MDKRALTRVARDAVAGDTRALACLLDELEPLVVRTTRLIVGSGGLAAEDAAQEALIDMARAIATLRNPEAVVGWAARIATRRGLHTARWERIRRSREHDLMPSPSAIETDDGRRGALSSAFDRLPRRQRAIAVLRLYLGLTEAETADVLGISVGAVKSQLHHARRQLAQSLRDVGLAPATRTAASAKGTP